MEPEFGFAVRGTGAFSVSTNSKEMVVLKIAPSVSAGFLYTKI